MQGSRPWEGEVGPTSTRMHSHANTHAVQSCSPSAGHRQVNIKHAHNTVKVNGSHDA